jgi:hypothetical protein
LDLGKYGRQNIWIALHCVACHFGSQITFPEQSDSKYIKQNETENQLSNDIKYKLQLEIFQSTHETNFQQKSWNVAMKQGSTKNVFVLSELNSSISINRAIFNNTFGPICVMSNTEQLNRVL